jgi:hypothetical protein
MAKHIIKYDRRQKYAIKVAKEKHSKSIFEAVNYLNARSEKRLTIGECLLIMNGSLNFKLKDL